MNEPALGTPRRSERTSDVYDTIPMLVGGWLLGAVTIAFCACVDGMAIAIIQRLVVGTEPTYWPVGAVIAAALFSVALSLAMGYWLFHLRRWIGTKSDPADADTVRRKRRNFTIGSMCGYVMLTPLVWIALIAIANSTAQAP